MSLHLPLLMVAVPLIGAPICLLLRHPVLSRGFAIGVAWACFAMALMLLGQVVPGEAISYELGGFAPPWGIELRIDTLNAFVLVIVTAISAVVFPFGPGSAEAMVPDDQEHLYYTTLLLCLTGLLGITVTGDAFNVFVFLEISSLSSYALVALGRGRRAPMAAFAYLVMGTVGGTFFLLGVGLMYQLTGTLNMMDLAQRLQELEVNRTLILAFGLVSVGLSIKLAVFPVHHWLPNAYTFAPSAVSAFLASTSTKVMYYVLVRMIFTVFGAGFVFGVLKLQYLIVPVAVTAMFMGSLAAIYQANIKRLLAYSSVAQIGYMVLGLGLNSETGLTGGLVHLFNHALMKGGLFLAVACVTYRISSSRVEDMAGLGRSMPITMAAFVVGGLSLIGVPGTVGFVSKWYLVLGAIEQGWYAIAVLILLSSLLAVVYVWRVVEIVYFKSRPDRTKMHEAPIHMLIPTWILIGGCIYFGLNTELTVGSAGAAARDLLGSLP